MRRRRAGGRHKIGLFALGEVSSKAWLWSVKIWAFVSMEESILIIQHNFDADGDDENQLKKELRFALEDTRVILTQRA